MCRPRPRGRRGMPRTDGLHEMKHTVDQTAFWPGCRGAQGFTVRSTRPTRRVRSEPARRGHVVAYRTRLDRQWRIQHTGEMARQNGGRKG